MMIRITVRSGATGPEVFPIALGCMGMSGHVRPSDRAESVATIHAALDRGVNLLDTGDFYGMGHNELPHRPGAQGPPRPGAALREVRRAPRPRRELGGLRWPPRGGPKLPRLQPDRLGVDYIDVYRPARLDPTVPIEDTIGADRRSREGRLRPPHRALRGRRRHPPPRRQRSTPSSTSRSSTPSSAGAPKPTVFPALAELGVATTAYGVLSRGLLAGSKPDRGLTTTGPGSPGSPAKTPPRTSSSSRPSTRWPPRRA
jgi:hypothetical protein